MNRAVGALARVADRDAGDLRFGTPPFFRTRPERTKANVISPATDPWRNLFEHWPASIPRQGILVAFGEQVPFTNFLVSGGSVLLERHQPDTSGARKVIVAYSAIQAVKLTDPGDLARYQALGFQPPM